MDRTPPPGPAPAPRPAGAGRAPRPLAALVLPVWSQWRAGHRAGPGRQRRRARSAALAVAAPLVAAIALVAAKWPYGQSWVRLADHFSPVDVGLVAVLASVGLLISALTAGWLAAPPRPARRRALVATTAGASVVALVPAAAGLYYAIPAQRLLDSTFVAAPVARPSALAGTAPSTTAISSAAADTVSEVLGIESRFNVLLLGGDAGADRDGLRTDSLNVASIDPATGDTVLIGIPRNLGRAPMPPGPLADTFPDGFDDIMNAVYGWGRANPTKVQKALGRTDDPGATLVAASVAEFTGLRIDGWVLVDMAGFIAVVDALGGVDLDIRQEVPSAGNVIGAAHINPDWYTVGVHHLDGTDALDYSRSREADSDYQRMARQRCVLANLAAQHSGPDLLRRWPQLASALSATVRTNLSVKQMAGLIETLRGRADPSRSIGLIPPDVPEYSWDAADVRALVADFLETPPPTTTTVPAASAAVVEPVTTSSTIPPDDDEPICIVMS